MNSSQPTDQPGDSAVKSDPIVLDAEVLKEVAGGTTHVGDPVWFAVPDGQASAS